MDDEPEAGIDPGVILLPPDPSIVEVPNPPQPEPVPEPSTKMKLGDKEIDLALAMPLTLRDWRNIKKVTGKDVTVVSLSDFGIDAMIPFIHYVFAKANPAVTLDDVEEMSLQQLIASTSAVLAARSEASDVNIPT